MSRFVSFCSIAAVAFGLGCHSTANTHANDPHTATTPEYPQNMRSASGGMADPGNDPRAASVPQPAPTTQGTNGTSSDKGTTSGPATNAPPPSAPVTGATPPSGGFKPDNGTPPPGGTGGGPKSDTGGAVFGDGHEGNTGAIKGGDAPVAPK
jgi:hypothetical protein